MCSAPVCASLTRCAPASQRGQRDLARTAAHPALRHPVLLIRDRLQDLDLLSERIFNRQHIRLTTTAQRLAGVEGRLTALNPRGVLLRGYALVLARKTASCSPPRRKPHRQRACSFNFSTGSFMPYRNNRRKRDDHSTGHDGGAPTAGHVSCLKGVLMPLRRSGEYEDAVAWENKAITLTTDTRASEQSIVNHCNVFTPENPLRILRRN